METLAEKHWNLRFDDLVRSERYFTATLLPAVLFHDWDSRRGIKYFTELVDKKATTEHKEPDKREPKGPTEYDFQEVEVITEFHIARDLEYKGLPLEANVGPSEPVRDAPDVVIFAGRELVVCESKFFSVINFGDLNEQLRSQRHQVRHLFRNRRQSAYPIRAYRHVAIMPERFEQIDIDADAILTWDDIRELAKELMGPDHYVTARLYEAVNRYKPRGNPKLRNYDGILEFDKMRQQ